MGVCRNVQVWSQSWLAFVVLATLGVLAWMYMGLLIGGIEMADTMVGVIRSTIKAEHPTKTFESNTDPSTAHGAKTTVETNTDSILNQTAKIEEWTNIRKDLLSKDRPRKVLLSAYMRGGSSIAGEIFNQEPSAVYWYEPIGPFYMNYFGLVGSSLPYKVQYDGEMDSRIVLTKNQQGLLGDYFDAMFTCDYKRLPPIAWLHPFISPSKSSTLVSLKNCLRSEDHKQVLFTCPQLRGLCGGTSGIAEAQRLHCFELIQETQRLLEQGVYENSTELSQQLLNFVLSHREIPSEMLNMTSIFAERAFCVNDINRRYYSCLEDSQSECEQAQIHAGKIIRLNLEYLQYILEAVPDMHVVHLVRDPRGIAASRLNSRGLMIDFKAKDVMVEVAFLCRKMREDLKRRHEIENQFPGAVLQVRYEDLVMDPHGVATSIYHFIGKDVSTFWLRYADIAFHGETEERNIRKNGTESISKWREHFTQEQVYTINGFCSDVLSELHYSTDL